MPSVPLNQPFQGDTADDKILIRCSPQPFEPNAMGMMAVSAELIKMTMAAQSSLKYRGPIRFLKTSIHDGRDVSLATALKEYRERIKRNPESVPDLLGLGNIYSYIESRKLAADCYSRCLAVEPECVEAAHNLAEIYFKDGEHEAAFKLLENAWIVRDRWRFHRLRSLSKVEFISSFIGRYNKTARKIGRHELVSPGVDASAAAACKVGRNDPCPCGSGKKYKKCCG
jgi:tetratricopeptide (TPR) repeat protein